MAASALETHSEGEAAPPGGVGHRPLTPPTASGHLRLHDAGGVDLRACRGLGSPHCPCPGGVWGVTWAFVSELWPQLWPSGGGQESWQTTLPHFIRVCTSPFCCHIFSVLAEKKKSTPHICPVGSPHHPLSWDCSRQGIPFLGGPTDISLVCQQVHASGPTHLRHVLCVLCADCPTQRLTPAGLPSAHLRCPCFPPLVPRTAVTH